MTGQLTGGTAGSEPAGGPGPVDRRMADVILRLEDHPFILADRALSRRATELWFRGRNIRPKIYAEVSGHEAIIAMVQLGFGLGVVPRLVLDQSPLATSVRILNLQPALPEYRIGICAQRRRLSARAVEAFWSVGVETRS